MNNEVCTGGNAESNPPLLYKGFWIIYVRFT
jgi:hypothetical protein